MKGTHEALVSRELFDSVQQKRESRRGRTTKRSHRDRFHFSGLLICSHCGLNMNGHYQAANDSIRYVCSGYMRYGTVNGCRAWSVSQDVLVEFLLKLIAEVMDSPEQIDQLRSAIRDRLMSEPAVDPVDLKAAKKRLRELDKQIDRAGDRLLKAEDLEDLLIPKLKAMRTDRDRLASDLKTMNQQADPTTIEAEIDAALACFEELITQHESAPARRFRELIRRVIQRIEFEFEPRPNVGKKRKFFQVKRGVVTLASKLPIRASDLSLSYATGL